MSATVLSPHLRASHTGQGGLSNSSCQTPSIAFGRLRRYQSKSLIRRGNMRLTAPARSHSFGLLRIAEEVSVVELDDTPSRGVVNGQGDGKGTMYFSENQLGEILSKMVIVVPCKDEQLSVIRDVISAIPTGCLVILVSNCPPQDYPNQTEMLRLLGQHGRQLVAVHQKDHGAAAAFLASPLSILVDPTENTIRNGKGEGMLLAIALAAAFCPARRYIGFVDADNLHPGSVTEYCKAFAAGFAMPQSAAGEDIMVRLKWASKPKLREDGSFDNVDEGRCSRVVNPWLNKLFTASGYQPSTTADGATVPFVTTGNAGEHAMTMGLALKLRMAAGYAIEPFHFVDLLERGLLMPPSPRAPLEKTNGVINGAGGFKNDTVPPPRALDKPVHVLQVRTMSPHYHRATDDTHIRKMWAAGLGSIYHGLAEYRDSTPDSEDGAISELRDKLDEFARDNLHGESGEKNVKQELPSPRIYPALEGIDLAAFRHQLEGSVKNGSLRAYGLVR